MIATISLGIISITFAYLSKYKNIKWGLKASFALIFIFLAIRYYFGNDYHSYLEMFTEINKYDSVNYFDKTLYAEPGWILLCRLFKPVGFYVMVAVLSLINCIVYYFFIKKNIPVQYYWLAIFLYIFSPGFMLIHLSAMRQSLSISIFLVSLNYLFKKDLIRYLLCITVASFIHTSALILFPIFLIGLFNWKINRITGAILISVFIALFVFGESIIPNINQFISNYFERYEAYQGGSIVGTGIGVLYLSVLFCLTVCYERFQNKENEIAFKIAIISFMFIPLSLVLQLIGRVGMYFAPATIIVYPLIVLSFKKPIYKTIFVSILLFMTLYEFFQFFSSETFKGAYGTYHTIFSSSLIF
jgi:hypothetical protein